VGFVRGHSAEVCVVDGGGNGGIFAADGAGGIAAELEFAEAGAEGVRMEKAAEEGFAVLGEELDGFGGLEGADESGEDAKDAGGIAVGHGAGSGGDGKHAAVTRSPKVGSEDANLSFELMDRAVDEGFFQPNAGVAGEVAGGEVVAAIENEVVVRGNCQGVRGGEGFGMKVYLQFGIEGAEAAGGGVDFELAEVFGGEKDLALEVG
jgi:hypothetical protein